MDIIDHFSKWMWSYPMKEKTAQEAVRCIKSFIFSFGLTKKLHTDNGLEVKNKLMDDFCAKYNIKHIYSKPSSPKSNGAVEASHKQIKKLILEKFYTSQENEFDLDDAILSAVNFHNNTVHSSTKYKPIFLRDITDINLINKVNENISQCITTALKYKNNYLLDKDDYILINDNIKILVKDNKKYIKKNKINMTGEFNIPAIFKKYTNNNDLEIICKKKI